MLIIGVILFVIIWFSSNKHTNNTDSFIYLKKYIKEDTFFNKTDKVKDIVSTGNLCINESQLPAKAIFDVTLKYSDKKKTFVRFFMLKDSINWKVINYEVNPQYSIYKGCN